jgi:hypothetical protein
VALWRKVTAKGRRAGENGGGAKAQVCCTRHVLTLLQGAKRGLELKITLKNNVILTVNLLGSLQVL